MAVVRCGLKLSQTIAILVVGGYSERGYSERGYRQNSRNRARVLRGLPACGVTSPSAIAYRCSARAFFAA